MSSLAFDVFICYIQARKLYTIISQFPLPYINYGLYIKEGCNQSDVIIIFGLLLKQWP